MTCIGDLVFQVFFHRKIVMSFITWTVSITLMRPFLVEVSLALCDFWQIIHLLMSKIKLKTKILLEIEIKNYTIFMQPH